MAQVAPPQQELNTWKEIALYLGVSVRQAQQWETEGGLPIRRIPGKKPRVWALASELDNWKLQTSSIKVVARPPDANSFPHENKASWPHPSRRTVIGSVALASIAGGLAFTLRRSSARAPEQAVLRGNLLSALDGTGKVLWTHRFAGDPTLWDQEDLHWRVQLVDFEGSGEREVVCVWSPASGSDTLFCFSPTGQPRWALACVPPLVDYDGGHIESGWRVSHVAIGRSPEHPNSTILWATVAHETRWPGCVIRIDGSGRSRVQFANAGNVERIGCLPSPAGDLIFACGENNALPAAFAVLFHATDEPSSSPVDRESPARYRFANGPTGKPRAYVAFPTPEVAAQHTLYGSAHRLLLHDTNLLVNVDDGNKDVFLQYTLTQQLEPLLVSPSGSYDTNHTRFVPQHSLSACPERARPVIVRRWDPLTGWQNRKTVWR